MLASFVVGSVSFAWMVGKLHGKDLHQHGSGNLGATNAGRVFGKRWFFMVFFADVGKGLASVFIAQYFAADFLDQQLAVELLPCAAAIACILGHSFTIFHGFKGGKAVATSLGAAFALTWLVASITFGVWLLAWLIIAPTFKISRSDAVGPSSVLSALTVLIAHFSLAENALSMPTLPITILVCMISALFILRHRSNIRKFLGQVQENKTNGEK